MIEFITKRIFEQPIPEEWISQIEDHVEDMMKPVMIRIAQEAATEVFQSMSISARSELVPTLEEPPVDSNLMKLFNLERKKRRMSTSRLLETILWLHYGKPNLSYEEGYRTEKIRQKDILGSISKETE
jgi:hypothetical protein